MKKILFMILVVMVALASCDIQGGFGSHDPSLVGTWYLTGFSVNIGYQVSFEEDGWSFSISSPSMTVNSYWYSVNGSVILEDDESIEYHYSIDGDVLTFAGAEYSKNPNPISDIDGDGIADELDNLDDRLVGTWTFNTITIDFYSNESFDINGSPAGTWETRHVDSKNEIIFSTGGGWKEYAVNSTEFTVDGNVYTKQP
jgi:hypothetical protein